MMDAGSYAHALYFAGPDRAASASHSNDLKPFLY